MVSEDGIISEKRLRSKVDTGLKMTKKLDLRPKLINSTILNMAKKIDLIFCVLLALASLGHLFGTFKLLEFGSGIFVWSLSGVLAAALLTSLNILRNKRSEDKTIARIALIGNIGWVAIVILFGGSIGNYADPRVLFHGTAVAGLCYFSFLTLHRHR